MNKDSTEGEKMVEVKDKIIKLRTIEVVDENRCCWQFTIDYEKYFMTIKTECGIFQNTYPFSIGQGDFDSFLLTIDKYYFLLKWFQKNTFNLKASIKQAKKDAIGVFQYLGLSKQERGQILSGLNKIYAVGAETWYYKTQEVASCVTSHDFELFAPVIDYDNWAYRTWNVFDKIVKDALKGE